MKDFDNTCANCRKHLEPRNIKGFIEKIGNVCFKCFKTLGVKNG